MLPSPEFKPLTRRKFVQGAAAAMVLWERIALAAASSRAIEHGSPLELFDYADVCFAPGPHESQLEQTHKVLMGLDENSLLRPYRMAAGLPAPGIDLSGWYTTPRYLAETFGPWVSALSRYHAAKPDEPTRLKVQRLIAEYAKTIEPTGNIFRINGNPVYFHDKLVLGIKDACEFCLDPEARATLSKLMDASQFVLEKKASEELYKKIHEGSENYNFAETYFMAWALCGDDRYYELAKRDLDDGFIEPLSQGKNVLGGRHAYSHTNGLCGAAKAYLMLGDAKYLQAAVNGLAFADEQSFATGGYGPGELFLPKPAFDYKSPATGEVRHYSAVATPGDSILLDHNLGHFETGCGSYAHFKLTRYLIRITKNSLYGDSMERVMYNCALGILPLHPLGKAFYQSNYRKYARKAYFDGYGNFEQEEWPCCSGTLPQLAADYRISTYFRDSRGVFVNLYIPSTLHWSQADTDVSLTQAGDYPLSNTVTFTVEPSRPTTFAVRFRIPAWAQKPVLRVNGSSVSSHIRPGSFAEVRRRWRMGDRVELVLPKQLELKPVDDQHPDLVALRCGPLVLFAIGEQLPKLDRPMLLAAKQASPNAPEWRAGDTRFLPWWVIKDELYTTYHDVS
jgi:hypothetical protein